MRQLHPLSTGRGLTTPPPHRHSMNAPVMVNLEGESDPLQIALKELRERKIPITVRRFLPDGSYEVSARQAARALCALCVVHCKVACCPGRSRSARLHAWQVKGGRGGVAGRPLRGCGSSRASSRLID